MDSNNPNYERNPSKKKPRKKSSNNQSAQIEYQNPPFNPPFSQNTPNSSYYIPQNIPNSSYYVPQNTQNSQTMFHHHHQSHNVDSNIDNNSTPIRSESLDENVMEFDDDDDDENEGNDQYGEDGENSVHHVDASLYTQPSFQDLLSQFGSPPSFTQLVQPSQQHPNDEALIPSKKSWDLIEDIALICSVMNTSTDPIVSTNQKIRVRWQKVKEAYEAARMERPHLIPRRTADMLKCRWGRVAPVCLKWSGSYDEALRRKKSSTRDEDVLKEAHLIHQRKHGNFNLIEQWKILAKYNKWKQVAKGDKKNHWINSQLMVLVVKVVGKDQGQKKILKLQQVNPKEDHLLVPRV
ncbi:unnamed protein product [Amaranthus hypochondriacus]